jgi:zinc protease
MKAINRKEPPQLNAPASLFIPSPQQYVLPNGIPVCLFNMGEQDVVMIKLLFPAGTWQEEQKQISSFTARLLREGTTNMSGQDLMNRIEYYGANLQTKAKNNHAEVVIYSLTKHLPHLLPLLKAVVTDAAFPADELTTVLQNAKQNLLIQQEKADYIANESFREHLFGKQHPYGYSSHAEDYDAIQRDALQQFYKKHYSAENCVMYIAGKLSDADLQLIEQYLGGDDWKNGQRIAEIERPFDPFVPQKIAITKPDSVQASLCIGRTMFNKTHPDYQGFMVLNTILGGFFGSRLMDNIREEKGYTYGIYSTLTSYMQDGYFSIMSDVRNEVWQDAVSEIYSEIDQLQNDLVPDDELKLVRNYLNGTILQQLSGTFNLATTMQGVLVYGLDSSFFHRFVETINTISPQQLRDLAQRYLNTQDMLEVVAHG